MPGHILKYVARRQMKYKPGSTITKLALNIGNVMMPCNVPTNYAFDDDGYIYKDEEEEHFNAFKPNVITSRKFVKKVE